ncbi:TlyA family RNA methyltransferase [Halalkalibacter kiskunsagensis]|uniref:TlyA family RNA methyltransferase n=1 Tax=Halalkalibacter kiskunsagensis TaxID=1548599 RepID=A0ABV6KCH1_9BACI
MTKKERIDVLLVELGLIETREKAKRSIMAGLVFSGTERIDKPGIKVDRNTPLEIKGNPLPYVSRGGLKLEKAISLFNLSLEGKIVIDIGASTGGFTDCSLQNGAKAVYALDVGYNQLAWKLRQDERVTVMERTNFRYVTPEDLQEGLPQFATIDVSFISLKLILPVLKTILVSSSDVIALVKPQFEAGREQVGKKGIVRERSVHEDVLKRMTDFATSEGYDVEGLSFSPIKGGEGNIEFLMHLRFEGTKEVGMIDDEISVQDVVDQAHESLKTKQVEADH